MKILKPALVAPSVPTTRYVEVVVVSRFNYKPVSGNGRGIMTPVLFLRSPLFRSSSGLVPLVPAMKKASGPSLPLGFDFVLG